VPLPARRLSVHDVLALVFGQEIPGAGGSISAVRNMLSEVGERKTSLQLLDCGYGEQQCFVVSSREQYNNYSVPGFTMARLKSDFGFGLLQVNIPGNVEAILRKKAAGTLVLNPVEFQRKLEQLRQSGTLAPPPANPVVNSKLPREEWIAPPGFKPAPWLSKWPHHMGVIVGSRIGDIGNIFPEPLPLITEKFDLARLPVQPWKQVFHGIIELNPNHKESISAVVRMLGEETVGGRLLRWIDLEVTSRLNEVDYSEYARILVDAKEYEKSGDLLISKGWIAFGSRETVFAIPSDLNLDSIIDKRLRHQPKPEWNRIGAVDVLSMLFNAKLKPRTSSICTLRDEFAGILAGLPRTPIYDKPFRHKTGEMLTCERWESPKFLPNVNYSFKRSTQVPFGFVEVTLKKDAIKIHLDTESYRELRPEEWSNSEFGTPASGDDLPNWQVWTWVHDGKTYKAWAEFGGKIESERITDIILRDNAGIEIRVPMGYFSKDNQALISRGRYWGKKPWNSSVPQWRNLKEYNRKSIDKTVVFETGKVDHTASCSLRQLEQADQRWIEKLQNAKDSRYVANDIRSWQSFAGYVR
jgi:hypothetical protein